MLKRITPYIYIIFFLGFSKRITGQKLTLNITSKDSLENVVLSKMNFKTHHQSFNEIKTESESISKKLQSLGFFFNTNDSIQKKDSIYTSYFSLGKRIDKIIIRGKNTTFTKKELLPKNLEAFLNSITKQLEKEGRTFSKVKLNNIYIKDNILFADIDIQKSNTRKINKVIIKGYDDFPKSYVKHFLKIKENTIFNQKKIQQVSDGIKTLSFAKEIKPPEVLFSKDSTLLYVYLKKVKRSSFDGLINFNSKEDGNGLTFNGHLDLKLNNILNTGEEFELTWRANGEERQSLEASTQIPYIFNSAISTDIGFSIYKQDSTFLNTKFRSYLTYSLNNNSIIGINYTSENSTNSLIIKNNNFIDNYQNYFLGLLFTYKKPFNNLFENKAFLRINPSFGRRTNSNTNTNQIKVEFEASYLWELFDSNYFYIRNHSGYLDSKNFLENELFRIGGINSIRGFDNESIFSSKFTYLNSEYRYLTSDVSYIYSLIDYGLNRTNQEVTSTLTSIGIGYLFFIKNSNINLTYIVSKKDNNSFSFQKSRFGIVIKSFF